MQRLDRIGRRLGRDRQRPEPGTGASARPAHRPGGAATTMPGRPTT
ncbi:hypothetical protein OG534_01140 [Streptomyces sp. NBC_01294]|nr:hypothetical protein OG534_01140 [Streptomyces sp. NBC_01294]